MVTPLRRLDRGLQARPALALFICCTALYALLAGTSRGGNGYSADGTFAFEMAKSAVIDPGHAYLRDQNRNFSRWGIGLPLAFVPFVAVAEPVALAAPQRDRIPTGDHRTLLVNYPALGPRPAPDTQAEIDLELTAGRYAALGLVSHAGLSATLEQGAEIARLTLTLAGGDAVERPIRAGVETAEWAYDRADVRAVVRHQRPEPVGHHIGNPQANYYYAEWRFDPPVELTGAQVRYVAPVGRFYVDGVALRQAEGGWVDGPGVGRVWSERQNEEFFRRMWAPFANAFITALGVVLVYRLTRRFGYAVNVALAVALTYAFATMAWPYAKYDFAEPLVTTELLAMVWLLRVAHDTGLRRYAVAAGGVALFAIATKYVTAFALPIALVGVVATAKPGATWREAWRQARGTAVAFALPPVVALPVALLGAAMLFDIRLLYERDLIGGIQRGWLELPFALGIHGLLTSPGKGLLWYNPVLLVAVPAAGWFVRRHGWRALVYVAIPVAYVLLYSKKQVWYGGNAWGPRYLVPILPFLIVMAAPLIAAVAGRARMAAAKAALAAVIALSVGVQLLGVSKDFISYLDIFQQQVAGLLPAKGAYHGGLDYQPWSAIQPEGDFAAVLYAPPFSPLLAHVWLLRADAVNLLLPDRLDLLGDVLGRTPWSVFGISAQPKEPQNGLGLDFWSTTLTENFVTYPSLLVWVGLALVLVQTLALVGWGAVVRGLWRRPGRWHVWRVLPIGAAAAAILVFDTLHFML